MLCQVLEKCIFDKIIGHVMNHVSPAHFGFLRINQCDLLRLQEGIR